MKELEQKYNIKIKRASLVNGTHYLVKGNKDSMLICFDNTDAGAADRNLEPFIKEALDIIN